MSAVDIRDARRGDAPALARLIDQLGYRATEDEVAERLPLMRGPGYHALIAEAGGEVVGCLTTSALQVLHRPALVGRISMLVVAEGRRGGRIGARLVREAEVRLIADGCYMVEVTSNLALTDAHRFYEGLGYERTSARFARELERREDEDGSGR